MTRQNDISLCSFHLFLAGRILLLFTWYESDQSQRKSGSRSAIPAPPLQPIQIARPAAHSPSESASCAYRSQTRQTTLFLSRDPRFSPSGRRHHASPIFARPPVRPRQPPEALAEREGGLTALTFHLPTRPHACPGPSLTAVSVLDSHLPVKRAVTKLGRQSFQCETLSILCMYICIHLTGVGVSAVCPTNHGEPRETPPQE